MGYFRLSLILDGHKLQWHHERVNNWLDGSHIAPITIDCALTRRCNYSCSYCYSKVQENKGQDLSEYAIYRFLDDAAEIGVKAISFVSDGESTCSPYLYDAILRGKANGLDMALGTNGYMLKDDRLEEVLPALTYLRFNISAGEVDRYAEIMGCKKECYFKVVNTIKKCVQIKERNSLSATLGLQMVLLPEFVDQIIPLAKLGKELGVDYLVIKHCSDDEKGSLGVDYSKYFNIVDVLKEAEGLSDIKYLVKAKWSKLLSGGKRKYKQCYGPPFILQLSGSGLVAPCGMLFNERYKKFHIGNIVEQRFKEIWKSDRYWEVMNFLASPQFNAQTMCGTLCLQNKVNECLYEYKKERLELCSHDGSMPMHINFV